MGQAYSAGLTVTESTVLRKERLLPLKGNVLVKQGDKVKAEDVVAETLLPGKVVPLNLANKLGVTPIQLVNYVKVKPGDQLKKGDLLAENKGLFGLGILKNSVPSPTDGEVESISQHTGQILLREPRIPVQVKAFMEGVITEVMPGDGVVIENKSAYIQGIFGIGGETVGNLMVLAHTPTEELNPDLITEACKDKVIVAGAFIRWDAIDKARKLGVKAIITGGVDDQDIKKILGYDLGVAITGHENVGITLVCTEGFGKINMARKTFDLLKQFEGKKTSIHGKTQIRAGVMRPEIIIPLEFQAEELAVPVVKVPILQPGTLIRVIRQPNFGQIAKVVSLPEELTVVESETKVRVLEAQFEDGRVLRLPRANVEVIES